MKLLPYIHDQAVKSANSGVPMMRPLFMIHPEDDNSYEWEDEYYFGECLLIAPLLKKGITYRNLYLPEGKWIGFFSKKTYKGENVICSKMEDYPVFVKAESNFGIDGKDCSFSEKYKKQQ